MTFQIIAENKKLEIREKVMILKEIHENRRKQILSLSQYPVLTINNKKKHLERENIFLCEKSTFGDLKSILDNIFLKSGGSL